MRYIKLIGRIALALSISLLSGASSAAKASQESASQLLIDLPETRSHSSAAAFAGNAGNRSICGKLPPCLIQNIAQSMRIFYATVSQVLVVDSRQNFKLNTAPSGAQMA